MGDYYKSIHNIKRAMHYYLLAADLDIYAHELDQWGKYNPAEIQANLRLKVGDLYFNGKWIRKDLKKALFYHALGLIEYNNNRVNYYSKKYFNTTNIVLLVEGNGYFNGDTSRKFTINPFFVFRKISPIELSEVVNYVRLVTKGDSSLVCSLKMEGGNVIPRSELGQAILYRFLRNIQLLLERKNILNPDKNRFRY